MTNVVSNFKTATTYERIKITDGGRIIHFSETLK